MIERMSVLAERVSVVENMRGATHGGIFDDVAKEGGGGGQNVFRSPRHRRA